MPTLSSMVNETGNRNRILDMYKFRIRFRLVHCGTITSVARYGFRQILHADQKCDRFYVWCFGNHKPEVDISDFRGVRIPISALFSMFVVVSAQNSVHCTRSSANAESLGYLAVLFALAVLVELRGGVARWCNG